MNDDAGSLAVARRSASSLTSIGRRSLSAEVYRQVRRALTTGEFLPGQRLNIRVLAESFETSPTPVREALLQLATEGALDLRAGHAFSVPAMTKRTYLELRDMRMSLEGLGAARAAERISRSGIEKLSTMHDKLIAAKNRRDFKAALRWNESFHLALCTEAGMPRLLRTVEGLWAQAGPLLNMLYGADTVPAPENQVHGHVRIMEALRKRDAEAARAGMEDDIAGSSAALLARLTA